MKIKTIITGLALIISIFGLGYFVLSEDKGSSSSGVCFVGVKPGKAPPDCPNAPICTCSNLRTPWSRYEGVDEQKCSYQEWYSIGDKLQPNCENQICGNPKDGYLAAGRCDPKNSGKFYKVCCNPDGTVGHTAKYLREDTVRPPDEGVCREGKPVIPKEGYEGKKINTDPGPGEKSPYCTAAVTATPQPTSPPFSPLPFSPLPISPTPLSQIQPGICNPAIKVYVRKGEIKDWQKEGEGKITYNTPTTKDKDYILKKNDTLEIDVRLVNRGTKAVTLCGYQLCQQRCYTRMCIVNIMGIPTPIPSGSVCEGQPIPPNCFPSYPVWCNKWSSTIPETHTNEPVCEIREPVKINVSLNPNSVYKYYENQVNDRSGHPSIESAPTFEVNPRIIFGKTFEFLNSRFGFKRSVQHKDPNDTAKVEPQRHGTYYVLAEKSSGNVYNVPNKKTVAGDPLKIYKRYVWCEVPVWNGSGWTIKREEKPNGGSFTLWQREPNFKLPVSPAQVEFYVTSTDVDPILHIIPPFINHPPASKIKTANRTYIAGYPITIEYGVKTKGWWGKDMGVYWLSGFEEDYHRLESEKGGEYYATAILIPKTAGELVITAYHNADDEQLSRINAPETLDYHPGIDENEAIGDTESISTVIQVYRYLCYQGFCWECPEEPEREGIRLKVKDAGCKVVEDIKCQTYIPPNPHKSCKGGVKE